MTICMAVEYKKVKVCWVRKSFEKEDNKQLQKVVIIMCVHYIDYYVMLFVFISDHSWLKVV